MHIIHHKISKLNKYDCHEENNFYLEINTPKNQLNITLRRKLKTEVQVMPNGTSYIGVDISTEYFTNSTIYEYMKQEKNVVDMEVKCMWQGYGKTYKLIKVLDKNINETDETDFNLYNYWQEKSPYKLKGINPNNTKTVLSQNG